MTRGYKQIPEDFTDIESMQSGPRLIGNMMLFFFILGAIILACMWLFSDISGEYYMRGQASSVKISIIRQATNLWGELTFGRGAVMRLITTELPKDDMVNLVFETPPKWLAPGEKPRQVSFVGTVKDGVMKGEFHEGKRKIKATLERSGINSVYRQVESHLPWQLYQRMIEDQELGREQPQGVQ